MNNVRAVAERVIANVEKVIIGKHDAVELAFVSLLCRGHILIEDVPGVGKTVLAKCLAKSIGPTFRRIQFTPDLLPSDVTGVSVFNQKTREFEFLPAPVMAQIVLTDEINRAIPKSAHAKEVASCWGKPGRNCRAALRFALRPKAWARAGKDTILDWRVPWPSETFSQRAAR